jgi:hypothetical protein
MAQEPSARRMKGQTATILGAFCIVTFPMLIFNIILIVIIAKYAEPDSASRIRDLQAIYVNINATTLTTFTSWSSTVAPLLGSFMVLLATYPACKKMINATKQGTTSSLPSPYQLAIMIQMRAGAKYRALAMLLQYRSSYRGKRAPITPPLITITSILTVGVFLGSVTLSLRSWTA